jgi:pimeloyl-ACP methyl ester carboxylesterase
MHATEAASPKNIVLIHGLWMTPLSWEGWKERFESKGFNVIAPAWPGFEVGVEELRKDPVKHAAGLGIKQIVDHYETEINKLDSPPIIIGHSFGGLFTQLLLDRGLGVAGVGLDAAQPKGVQGLPLSTIKCTTPILKNPFSKGGARMQTEKEFHYAFTNTLSAEDSKPYYDKYAVPASNSVLFEGALANFSPKSAAALKKENNDRAPLLLIAGGQDHVVTAGATRKIYKLQKKHSTAITAYKEYPDRPHLTGAVPGWEEVADFALDWALNPVAIAP